MKPWDYVKFGKTGLGVSRLCVGCMTYGIPDRGPHPWTLDEEKSRPLIKQALELGINFFDTANVYSDGTSEEIVGRALKEFVRRDDVVIATKLNARMRPGAEWRGIVAQGDHGRDRQQPAPARHRLRRPVPDSSRRSDGTDRGDDGSACTKSSKPARRATSARPTCMPGNSSRRFIPPASTAGPNSSACRITSTC